jgi:hypothetical protein
MTAWGLRIVWPNESTLWLLLAGLLPLAYAARLAVKYGVKELSSLRFLGVLFIWVGYQFSPWQSYLTGEMWDHYLLVPGQINNALLFTTLAMFALLIGYASVFSGKFARLRRHMAVQFALPMVKPGWVFGLVVLVLTVTIITVGGLDEFWASQFARGHGQFEKRDFWGSIRQMLGVIRLPLEVMLGLMASLLILRAKGSGPAYLLGFAALIVASLSSMWNFSRAAGFPFLFLAFLALRMNARRSLVIVLPGVMLAIYLGSVGYHERGNYPGIANFIQAAFSPDGENGIASGKGESQLIENTLDAMAPFTRKAEQRELEPSPPFTTGVKFFWNLNPLPSEIVPIYPLGRGLSEVMGTYGHVGLTTPAFAESYYVFGLVGVGVVALLGAAFGWFERLTVVKPGVASSIAVTLAFMSLAVGLHSSMRAMTRPMVYAAFLVVLARLVFSKRRSTRRMTGMNQ